MFFFQGDISFGIAIPGGKIGFVTEFDGGIGLAFPGVGADGFLTHYSLSEKGNFMQSISGKATNNNFNIPFGGYTKTSSEIMSGHKINIGPKFSPSKWGFSETTSKSAVVSTSGIYGFDGKKK